MTHSGGTAKWDDCRQKWGSPMCLLTQEFSHETQRLWDWFQRLQIQMRPSFPKPLQLPLSCCKHHRPTRYHGRSLCLESLEETTKWWCWKQEERHGTWAALSTHRETLLRTPVSVTVCCADRGGVCLHHQFWVVRCAVPSMEQTQGEQEKPEKSWQVSPAERSPRSPLAM